MRYEQLFSYLAPDHSYQYNNNDDVNTKENCPTCFGINLGVGPWIIHSYSARVDRGSRQIPSNLARSHSPLTLTGHAQMHF